MTNPRVVTGPEPIRQSSAPTGRGVHWPAVIAKIHADGGPVPIHPDAETRRRLAESTPQAAFQPTPLRAEIRTYPLADDEHPTDVPARPYADIRRADGQQDRVGQVLATADVEANAEPVWVAYLFGRAIGWFRR